MEEKTTEALVPTIIVLAGKLFYLESGCYSDRCIRGHFVALVDITYAHVEVAKSIAVETARGMKLYQHMEVDFDDPDDYEVKNIQFEFFIPSMIKQGIMMEVDAVPVNYGDYGDIDIDIGQWD